MLKLTTKHQIYEVWCEHFASSVYVDHKPTQEELEILREMNWVGTKRKLLVEKLSPVFTRTKKVKKM